MDGAPSGFRRRRTGGAGLKFAVVFSLETALLIGMLADIGRAQLLADYTVPICELMRCIGWCECTGAEIDVANFKNDILFNACSTIPQLQGYSTCTNDPSTAVIAQRANYDNLRTCQTLRENPLIFFKNASDGVGADFALRVWEGADPNNYDLVSELCAPQCNPLCGITMPTSPKPSTEAFITRKIDDVIPKLNTTLAPINNNKVWGLTPYELRLLGIAIGAFVAGLVICLVVVYFCCRKRKRTAKAPKLPPRRYANGQNRDYATIEEVRMTPMNQSPRRTGGAFPNVMYRSESLSALGEQNTAASKSSSMTDLALLGDPPHPPVQRQVSLLPGINPAMAEGTDGRSAPLDEYGYTKYLPDEEHHAPPYMHLRVTPTVSDPDRHGRVRMGKPHRYRSNTGGSHASVEDSADRVGDRVGAREALRDGSSNRRFVPNQSPRARSSTFGGDYGRLVRQTRRGAVPKTRKTAKEAGSFTASPVYGEYQSRPRRSPQSIRKWRSLPDMFDEVDGPSRSARRDQSYKEPPVYQLLNPSPASSIGDYSRRRTHLMTDDLENGYIDPIAEDEPGSKGPIRSSGRGRPTSDKSRGQSDTMGSERYDPVYEPRVPSNGHIHGITGYQGDYQPLALSESHPLKDGDLDEEDDAYHGPEELFDNDAYLQPKQSARLTPTKQNGQLNGDLHRGPKTRVATSPTASISSNGNHSSRGNSNRSSRDKKPYDYEGDNNNHLPGKSTPSRTVGGSVYTPVKPTSNHVAYDFDDDLMENGEYQYHPAGPSMDPMMENGDYQYHPAGPSMDTIV